MHPDGNPYAEGNRQNAPASPYAPNNHQTRHDQHALDRSDELSK
jgi:hypothetical protein